MLLAVPLVAPAQGERIFKVASFRPNTAEGMTLRATFRAAMRELGYVEGRNIVYLDTDAGKNRERLKAAAAELIAHRPDILVVGESDAKVLRAGTTSIPIVLTGGFDPVGAGLAQSLRRPGANVTGVIQFSAQLPEKHVEILTEILPRVSRLGMLFDKGTTACVLVEGTARQALQRLGKELVAYEAGNKADLERAFAAMEQDRPDALLPCPSVVLFNYRDLLFSEGMRLRIPWTSFVVANVPLGVLFAYASNQHDEFRTAARYVDRILKGANPAELPIEQPTRLELVVNLKTAKALGIAIPNSILVRANRLIE